MQLGVCVCVVITSVGIIVRQNKSVTSFIMQTSSPTKKKTKKTKQVESESRLLLLVSSQEPLEVIIAEKEHSGNQSHLWHALSDNVVEMEISCSNRDENEFAGLISPATFPRRRGEPRFFRKRLNVCAVSVGAQFFLTPPPPPNKFFRRRSTGRVSALLSSPRDGSARAFHKE